MQVHSITLIVHDYDEAISFYTQQLGFVKTADDHWGEGFRWVALGLPLHSFELVLTLATDETLQGLVGKQAGYHQFFSIQTADIEAIYLDLLAKGVVFLSEPREMFYGTQATFQDLYGNKIGLLQPPV